MKMCVHIKIHILHFVIFSINLKSQNLRTVGKLFVEDGKTPKQGSTAHHRVQPIIAPLTLVVEHKHKRLHPYEVYFIQERSIDSK